MSSVVPWDGVYRIQNVDYHEQNIGLKDKDVIVVGRHEDSVNPRIEASSGTNISLHYRSALMAFAVGNQGHHCRQEQQDNHQVGL